MLKHHIALHAPFEAYEIRHEKSNRRTHTHTNQKHIHENVGTKTNQLNTPSPRMNIWMPCVLCLFILFSIAWYSSFGLYILLFFSLFLSFITLHCVPYEMYALWSITLEDHRQGITTTKIVYNTHWIHLHSCSSFSSFHLSCNIGCLCECVSSTWSLLISMFSTKKMLSSIFSASSSSSFSHPIPFYFIIVLIFLCISRLLLSLSLFYSSSPCRISFQIEKKSMYSVKLLDDDNTMYIKMENNARKSKTTIFNFSNIVCFRFASILITLNCCDYTKNDENGERYIILMNSYQIYLDLT